MKKLITLLFLAPMIAGAQVDTADFEFKYDSAMSITIGSGLSLLADTYTDVTDTIRSQMLVVDTCKDGPVLFINGYIIRKYRKYENSYRLRFVDYPETVGILNRNKKPLSKCFCILERY